MKRAFWSGAQNGAKDPDALLARKSNAHPIVEGGKIGVEEIIHHL